MSERAKLQREITRASIISSSLFIFAAALPLIVPSAYETYYLIVMGVCIAVAIWWTVKLQRLRMQGRTTPD